LGNEKTNLFASYDNILSCLTSDLKIKSLSQKQNPKEFRVVFLVKAFLLVYMRLQTVEYKKAERLETTTSQNTLG